MVKRFQNKYRIESTRLQNWDYGWNGAYFITLCTKNRDFYFGNITNGKMELSNIGVIANILYYEIKNRAKNLKLGEFIVMPNHIHGILILNGNNGTDDNNGTVETGHSLSQTPLQSQQQKTIGQKRFQNIGKNTVSSIIGSYKSAVTKHAHRLGYDFAWQPRYYDHIIRNEQAFRNISKYIINNPAKWNNDKFHPLHNGEL